MRYSITIMLLFSVLAIIYNYYLNIIYNIYILSYKVTAYIYKVSSVTVRTGLCLELDFDTNEESFYYLILVRSVSVRDSLSKCRPVYTRSMQASHCDITNY